jgi:hypothetical protein
MNREDLGRHRFPINTTAKVLRIMLNAYTKLWRYTSGILVSQEFKDEDDLENYVNNYPLIIWPFFYVDKTLQLMIKNENFDTVIKLLHLEKSPPDPPQDFSDFNKVRNMLEEVIFDIDLKDNGIYIQLTEKEQSAIDVIMDKFPYDMVSDHLLIKDNVLFITWESTLSLIDYDENIFPLYPPESPTLIFKKLKKWLKKFSIHPSDISIVEVSISITVNDPDHIESIKNKIQSKLPEGYEIHFSPPDPNILYIDNPIQLYEDLWRSGNSR